MFAIAIDVKAFSAHLTNIEKRQFPFALATAINETAFLTREAWKAQIGKVFDRPTPLTRNAVLYKKATKANALTAEIFIRDEVSEGVPPSEYLKPQEFGGARKQKSFERKLARHPRARQFYVPGKGAPLNPFGNVPVSVLGKIFSQLRVAEDRLGFTANETDKGRTRRLKRLRKKGGGGSYFILPVRRGKLRAGVVYERINDLSISDAGDARATSKVRSILFPVDRAPRYKHRLNALSLARNLFNQRFASVFRERMARAVATAR